MGLVLRASVFLFFLFPRQVFSDLVIGAFNIQTFGQAKYNNGTLRVHLVDIVTEYDLLLLQEIRDASQTMIFNFLRDCQALRPSFDMILSPRLGRTASYKEQYAILFDSTRVTPHKTTIYSNSLETFSRPPIISHFSARGYPDFTVFGLHADPDDVVPELNEFPGVYEEAVRLGYPATGIFMGDMNADCSYLSNAAYTSLKITTDSRFQWLVDKDVDTTVSRNTDCSYDRIMVCGVETTSFVSTSIHSFDVGMSNDLAKKVSDHYPIRTTWVNSSSRSEGNKPTSSYMVFPNNFPNLMKDFLCFYFPILQQHRNEEWFDLAVVFLVAVVVICLRKIVACLGLVVL